MNVSYGSTGYLITFVYVLLFPLAFVSVGLWLEGFILLSTIYFPDEFKNPNLAKLTRFVPSSLFLDEPPFSSPFLWSVTHFSMASFVLITSDPM